MITAEEIRFFMKKKDAICDSFNGCSECPVTAGKNGRCTLKYITQKQVDIIMNWEPPVDWSKVAPDTKIIVWTDYLPKCKRHFAKYKDGRVYSFMRGKSSYTADNEHDLEVWQYAELSKEDE